MSWEASYETTADRLCERCFVPPLMIGKVELTMFFCSAGKLAQVKQSHILDLRS